MAVVVVVVMDDRVLVGGSMHPLLRSAPLPPLHPRQTHLKNKQTGKCSQQKPKEHDWRMGTWVCANQDKHGFTASASTATKNEPLEDIQIVPEWSLTPSLPCLPRRHPENRPLGMPNLKS